MSGAQPAHASALRSWATRPLALATALFATSCADAHADISAIGAQPLERRDRPQNPLVGATATPDGPVIAGHVEERLVAASYVYLAIRDGDGAARWAVVMGDAPPVGAAITVHSMGRRAQFHSSRLQRTFAELHFATLEAPRPHGAPHSDREPPHVEP